MKTSIESDLVELQSQAYELRNTTTKLSLAQPYEIQDFLRVINHFQQLSKPYASFSPDQVNVKTPHTTITTFSTLEQYVSSEPIKTKSYVKLYSEDQSLEVVLAIGKLEDLPDRVSPSLLSQRDQEQDKYQKMAGVKVSAAVIGGALLGVIPLLVGGGYMGSKLAQVGLEEGDSRCSVLFLPKSKVSIDKANAYTILVSKLHETQNEGGVRDELTQASDKLTKSWRKFTDRW